MPSVVDHRSLLRKPDFLRSLAVVGIVSTVVTVIMAWPVVQGPNELLFGSEMVGRHSDAYTVIRGFSDPETPPAFVQPGVDWIGERLANWIGGAAAYNLIVLLSFPLTALAVFALSLYLGISLWPAVWVAMLYAFSPLHIAHAAYHPHVAQLHWIPLVILFLVRANERWSVLRAVLLVAVIVMAGLSNFYAAMMLAVVLPVIQWVLRKHPVGDGRGWLGTTRTLIAVGVVGLLCVAFFYPSVIRDPTRLAFPAADAQRYAARPYAYLTPAVESPLLGTVGQAVWSRSQPGDALVEQQVYLGWVVLVLAIWALWLWRRRPALPHHRTIPLLLTLTMSGLVLSLTPVLQLGALALPTPSWLLRALAPMFRAYARFGFVVQLGIFLLAGLALTWFLDRRPRRGIPWVVALVIVSLLEFAPVPPWRAHPLYPNEGYRWLVETADDWSVIDCTLAPAVIDSVAILVDRPIAAADGDIQDCGEPDLAAKLAAQGITHAIGAHGGALVNRRGLTPVAAHLDGVVVYEVVADPVTLYVQRWSGLSWREGAGDESIRWSGSQAVLWLKNMSRKAETQRLEIELVAFPETRPVAVILNGEHLTSVQVPAERSWFHIDLPLGANRNRLQLIPEGAPVAPDSVLGNGDRRLLALAVGGVRYPVQEPVANATEQTPAPQ